MHVFVSTMLLNLTFRCPKSAILVCNRMDCLVTMQDGWIGLAWLAVPWYPVTVYHAGWVDWAGLVSSALVSSDSLPCRMGGLGWPG